MRIHDSGIHRNAENTDTPCTPSTPAIPTPTTMNDIPPASPDFSCPHCARHFNSRIGLIGHLRIHRTESVDWESDGDGCSISPEFVNSAANLTLTPDNDVGSVYVLCVSSTDQWRESDGDGSSISPDLVNPGVCVMEARLCCGARRGTRKRMPEPVIRNDFASPHLRNHLMKPERQCRHSTCSQEDESNPSQLRPRNSGAEMVRQDPGYGNIGANRNPQHPRHAEVNAIVMEDERLPTRLFYGDAATGARRQEGKERRYKDNEELS
ncbi:unnamed protein product [Schistocephalus solidus]|uniref:C2H2-type domain-containing protein n=1 Tax=Schistocephalus solidus TaxID=70667 RepID=A0A183T0S4_SCHSO|nr:unnamed protein product [Schistocephalus solidus]